MADTPLLVIDLNEVLVKKFFDKSKTLPLGDAEGRAWNHIVLRSPAASWVFDQARALGFRIIIWSSSAQRTIESVCDVALKDGNDVIVYHMDRTHCEEDTENPRIENNQNWAVIKDLNVVWDLMRRAGWDCGPRNTLIVDDSVTKTRRQPINAVIVPPYKPPSQYRNADYDAEYLKAFKTVMEPRLRVLASRACGPTALLKALKTPKESAPEPPLAVDAGVL